MQIRQGWNAVAVVVVVVVFIQLMHGLGVFFKGLFDVVKFVGVRVIIILRQRRNGLFLWRHKGMIGDRILVMLRDIVRYQSWQSLYRIPMPHIKELFKRDALSTPFSSLVSRVCSVLDLVVLMFDAYGQ